jgi:hypothetical protein
MGAFELIIRADQYSSSEPKEDSDESNDQE